MKKTLKRFVLSISIALIIIAIYFFVQSLTKGTNLYSYGQGFLQMIKGGHYQVLYEEMSLEYREEKSLEDFKREVKKIGLDKYRSVRWQTRRITKGKALILGFVTLEKGEKIPLRIVFIREMRKWKILDFFTPKRKEKEEKSENQKDKDIDKEEDKGRDL